MHPIIKAVAETFALAVEGVAVLIITYGAIEAAWSAVEVIASGKRLPGQRKQVWLRFGVWLLLGLEFELAADIVRTAISPTWNDIGQLAAIGVIRTGLNYFLEIDLDKYDNASASPRTAES